MLSNTGILVAQIITFGEPRIQQQQHNLALENVKSL
jgi:hypothetical protein